MVLRGKLRGQRAHFPQQSAQIWVSGSVQSAATTTEATAGGVMGPRAPPMIGGVVAATSIVATEKLCSKRVRGRRR